MKKENYVLSVGFMVFIGLFLLGVMVLAVGNFVRGDLYKFKINYQNVNGVDMYAPVMVSGVEMGSVVGISFKEDKEGKNFVEIVVAVKKDAKVYSDGEAGISTLGLMGEKYIDIRPGKKGELLKDGDTLLGVEPISTAELYKKVLEFSESIKRTMDGINSLLGDESVVSSVKETIQTAKSIAKKLDNIVTESGEDFKATMKNIHTASEDVKSSVNRISKSLTSFSENLNAMIETNTGDVRAVVKNFKSFSETINTEGKQIISDFHVVSKTVKDVTVDNKDNLNESLKNIRVASRDLQDVITGIQELSDKLNKGNGTLAKIINDEDMAKSFSNIVKETEKTVKNLKDLIDDFQQHPRRYFRFSAF